MSTNEIVHGAGKDSSQAEIQHTKNNVAPLPEGLSEVNDRTLSAGTSGHNSGKGGSQIHGRDEQKGIGSLPGTEADKKELGSGAADIADRKNPELHQKSNH